MEEITTSSSPPEAGESCTDTTTGSAQETNTLAGSSTYRASEYAAGSAQDERETHTLAGSSTYRASEDAAGSAHKERGTHTLAGSSIYRASEDAADRELRYEKPISHPPATSWSRAQVTAAAKDGKAGIPNSHGIRCLINDVGFLTRKVGLGPSCLEGQSKLATDYSENICRGR